MQFRGVNGLLLTFVCYFRVRIKTRYGKSILSADSRFTESGEMDDGSVENGGMPDKTPEKIPIPTPMECTGF